ncbi:MAG: SDR family oxidoreductase [Acidimicrobiales bacterium]|nr:SDR family oxidoreductase [Acidimicrobiales bacterium]
MGGRLEGRVAVVTGGGNGIGRACAVRFAEEGADVLVADVQLAAAEAVADAVRALGRRAGAVAVDVTSPDDNAAMAAAALEQLGGIDVVVTAAGISHVGYSSGDMDPELKLAMKAMDGREHPERQLLDLDLDDWHTVLAVNLTGTMLSVNACANVMAEQGRTGSIITIGSIASKHPDAGTVSYTVSKAGVWAFTKKAARVLAPLGIRVNSIGPGFIETHMTAILRMSDEISSQFMAGIPLGRYGQPIDIANCALFLASDESSYFTGEILHPDGGFYTE